MQDELVQEETSVKLLDAEEGPVVTLDGATDDKILLRPICVRTLCEHQGVRHFTRHLEFHFHVLAFSVSRRENTRP